MRSVGEVIKFRTIESSDSGDDRQTIETGTIVAIGDDSEDREALRLEGSFLANLPRVDFYVVATAAGRVEVQEAQIIERTINA